MQLDCGQPTWTYPSADPSQAHRLPRPSRHDDGDPGGAMAHAKILVTETACKVHGMLVDTYFAVKEARVSIPPLAPVGHVRSMH